MFFLIGLRHWSCNSDFCSCKRCPSWGDTKRQAPCGLRGCKNWPTPFRGRMSYKATKPGLVSVLYLSMHYTVLLFIRAPFYVSASFRCFVFCLLVLVKLSVLAKWLARKTPLRKPNRDEGIVSRKPRLKSAHDFLGLLYCFIVLLYICVVSCPCMTYFPNPTVMARYSLFVLKVPLNPKQTNKQKHSAYSRTVQQVQQLPLLAVASTS